MKKNNFKLLLILFFLQSFTTIFAQVEGIIVDSLSQKGIPFAIIHTIDVNVTTMADEHGHFKLQSTLPFPISIEITAAGYERNLLKIEPQKNQKELKISLLPSHFELNEVSIHVGSDGGQKFQITNVESKSIAQLNEITNPNLSEALTNIPGVYNNSTGTGIGKPVVRGLSGSRVLTSLNGLRIENQQWGGDHGLGVSELGIAQVNVIKGPASLLYGPDALGGVIHLEDEKFTAPGSFEGSYKSQFESNSMGFKNTVGIKTAVGKFRLNAFAYYNTSADYQLPDGSYLANSRWQEGAGKIALGYNKKNWVMNLRYNYNRSFLGLPGHTHDSIVDFASFRSQEQKRSYVLPVQIINSHFALLENTFFLKKGELKILAGLSSNELNEFEEKVSIPGIKNLLNSYSLNVKYKQPVLANGQILIGYQGQLMDNRNDPVAEEVLIPRAISLDNGIYSLFNWNKKTLEFQAGVRYDHRIIESLELFNNTIPSSFQYQGLNFSTGLVKKWELVILRTNVSSGFRPPNLSELMSYGVHHGTARFEIGNLNLSSEYATQADASLELAGEHLSIIANPFFNRISNFIFINPSANTIDGYPVFEYEQSQYATLIGGDLGFHYHPHFLHQLHLESSFSYIEAQDDLGNNLPLIPQARINSSVKLEFKGQKKLKLDNLSLQHFYHFSQNKTTVYETNSPAYNLIHIGAQISYKKNIQIKLGIRNILNEKYIDHLSRLKAIETEAPGRNFYAGVQWNITKSKNLH